MKDEQQMPTAPVSDSSDQGFKAASKTLGSTSNHRHAGTKENRASFNKESSKEFLRVEWGTGGAAGSEAWGATGHAGDAPRGLNSLRKLSISRKNNKIAWRTPFGERHNITKDGESHGGTAARG